MIVLGIWDGHNSSASLIENGQIKAAVSEERFTKRKLEPLFPYNSIKYCLNHCALNPKDIKHVALSTSDFSLTLTRLYPKIKDDYWYIRRKLTDRPIGENLNRRILNQTGKLKSNIIFRKISEKLIKRNLTKMGFDMKSIKIHIVDHHSAHVASAYFTSGYKDATSISLDALGDGYSSTIGKIEDNNINIISKNSTYNSIGLFFQEVTSILGLRILEDEGKVMALSDYAYQDKKFKNPLRKLFSIEGTKIKSTMGLDKRYNILKNLAWRNKSEIFAFMAQDALNFFAEKLVNNAINTTQINNLVLSGGITSNIKMNMHVRLNSNVNKIFVFPAMGDTGLSAGAALFVSNKLFGTKSYKIQDVYLGPKYNNSEIESILKKYKSKLEFEESKDVSKIAGELISNDEIVMWMQGRMEFGPRALGNRSILASASNLKIKDKLNINIKRRSFYQPFCPSIMKSEANKLISENEKYFDKFMTMGYNLKEESLDLARSVMNIDHSIRPQILGEENHRYELVLRKIKKETGTGMVLNTSFNVHGSPIVMTPKDALDTQLLTENKHLFLGDYHVTKKN